MLHSDLKGVVAAAVTPVTGTYSIDARRLAEHVEILLADGCSFVSTFGTTGEGASLSTTQKAGALDELIALGIDPAKLIPAVMTPALDEAGGMIAAAAKHGCRGVLVLPPFFYNDPSHEGLVGFVGEALNRAGKPDIGVLLYNIPRFTGVPFDAPLVSSLIKAFGTQIVGIKDSTGDEANSISLAQDFPDISVFTGDDRVMPGLVSAGGAGMIGGMPNLFAPELRRVFENPLAPETKPLRDRAAQRIDVIDSSGSLVAIKAVMAARLADPEWARPLPPLQALSPMQADTLLAALAKTGYEPQTQK